MGNGKDAWIDGCDEIRLALSDELRHVIARMTAGLCLALERSEVTTATETSSLIDRLRDVPDFRYFQLAEVVVRALDQVPDRSTTARPLADSARWVMADRANDALRRHVLGLDDKRQAVELLRRGEQVVRHILPPFDRVELAQNTYMAGVLMHQAGDDSGARAALGAASRALNDAEKAVRSGRTAAHDRARPMIDGIRENIDAASTALSR